MSEHLWVKGTNLSLLQDSGTPSHQTLDTIKLNWRSCHFVVEIKFSQISMVGDEIHIALHVAGFLKNKP